MSRTLKLSVLLVLLFPAAALAQLVNENLLVTLPPGYKVDFQDKKNNMQITEMVPANETVKDWTEMLTVQIFFGLKATPDQFKEQVQKGWVAACAGGDGRQIATSPENGYPALVWLLSCPRNPATGKPEFTWFKAVQGNDSLYVVQKAFKFVPSKEQVTQWMGYLRAVAVCDTRLPDRACPQTKR